MKRLEEPWESVLAITAGVVFALGVMIAIIVLTGPHDPDAAPILTTTTTGEPGGGTTTTEPATTTTTAPTTTTTPDPGIDFADDTDPKVNEEIEGDPGPGLTNIRFGAHPGFARIVFDFGGSGVPANRAEYAEGPFFTDGEGEEVDVGGDAFIVLTISPGSTAEFDDEEITVTYHGERRLDPRLDPIVEVVMTGDFEAQLTFVIGLTGEQGFRVFVLQDPLRLVVDIAE